MVKLARRGLALSIALTALVAQPAAAETTKATLGPAKPNFSWSGHGVGAPGFECSNEAVFRCDNVIFTLEVAGDLSVAIDVEGSQIGSGPGAYPNFDLYLFASDAEGAKKGDAIAEATTPIDDETLSAAGLQAGHYLLEVRSNESIGEDYTGKARLSNFALPAQPVAPAAPPTSQPPSGSNTSRPKSSRRARCHAKAKKIKNKRKRAAARKRCRKIKN